MLMPLGKDNIFNAAMRMADARRLRDMIGKGKWNRIVFSPVIM